MFFSTFEEVLKHSLKPLKVNEKYFIVLAEIPETKDKCVVKIQLDKGTKLQSEAHRINSLRKDYNFFLQSMLPILHSSTFDSGFLEGQFFYVMKYADGPTLAEVIVEAPTNSNPIQYMNVFEKIAKQTLEFDKSAEALNSNLLLDYILKDLEDLRNLPILKIFLKATKIIINGNAFTNPLRCSDKLTNELGRILKSCRLKQGGHLHNNFHGGNIILDEQTSSFHIIDPDISISICDTTFAIGRFLYTRTHEKCERGEQYFNKVEAADQETVKVNLKRTSDHGEELFEDIHDALEMIVLLDTVTMRRRVWLSLFQTLLRGIKANYSSSLTMYGKTDFCHGSSYLFLCLIILWSKKENFFDE